MLTSVQSVFMLAKDQFTRVMLHMPHEKRKGVGGDDKEEDKEEGVEGGCVFASEMVSSASESSLGSSTSSITTIAAVIPSPTPTSERLSDTNTASKPPTAPVTTKPTFASTSTRPRLRTRKDYLYLIASETVDVLVRLQGEERKEWVEWAEGVWMQIVREVGVGVRTIREERRRRGGSGSRSGYRPGSGLGLVSAGLGDTAESDEARIWRERIEVLKRRCVTDDDDDEEEDDEDMELTNRILSTLPCTSSPSPHLNTSSTLKPGLIPGQTSPLDMQAYRASLGLGPTAAISGPGSGIGIGIGYGRMSKMVNKESTIERGRQRMRETKENVKVHHDVGVGVGGVVSTGVGTDMSMVMDDIAESKDKKPAMGSMDQGISPQLIF